MNNDVYKKAMILYPYLNPSNDLQSKITSSNNDKTINNILDEQMILLYDSIRFIEKFKDELQQYNTKDILMAFDYEEVYLCAKSHIIDDLIQKDFVYSNTNDNEDEEVDYISDGSNISVTTNETDI